jgi:VCBS repeat-containing protein
MQREPDFIFERQTGGSFLPRSRSAPTPTRKASANQPLELLALEDRVLYSAVPIGLPDAAPNEPSELENLEQQVNELIHWTSLLAEADLIEPGATSETIGQSAPDAGGTILVVVDQGIADYQTLLDDIRNQLPQQHSLLLIDSTGDGWLQLNQYLSQHQGIQQVHLFSHAASGQLLLGNQSLQLDDLFNDDSAAIWQRALHPDADVFLYGCQLAADPSGELFVSQFAMFSGADVAASVDQTGNASGADWDLEFSVGLLDSDSLFSDDHPLHWEGTLDPQTFSRSGVQELSGIDRGSTSAVAVDSSGTYVIVWSEEVTGNGWDVLACRFNADGTQNGSVFTVNQSTNGDQRYASVDMDSSGRFIITWTGIDTGNDGILARLYAANGTALTSEFIVNTYRPSAQYNSSVSMAPDGRFAIAWEGNGSEDNQGIFAQRYDANANAVGSQIFVNSSSTGNQENPTVSMNSSGAFVVAWNDETSFRYQRFDSNGNKLDQNGIAASEVTVSGAGTARHGDILLNNDGTVVSTWQEYDSALWDVFYRTDAMNGTPLFSKTLVLGSTSDQLAPSIDGSGSGDFIISWEGRETEDPNGGVFYRLYNSSGLATPYTFLANSNYTTSSQGLGSVASTGLNNYVVVWSGNSANDATDIGHNNVRNAIPVAVNDAPTLPEAGGYNNSNLGVLSGNNVLLNDTDLGDTLTVVGIVSGSGGISTSNVGTSLAGNYGTITLQADGTFSYSLNQSNPSVEALRTNLDTLTETFTYTVRDSGFMVSTATLAITITGQNDAPTSVADTATAVEASGVNNGTAGTNPTGNVLTNDTDPDSGDSKTVTGVAAGVQASATGNVGIVVNGTYGSITISSAGVYTYTVNNANASVQALRTSGQTLSDVFTYTMSDLGGLTSTNQLTVTIQGANDTPTINAITPPSIGENSANGTVVTTASATEADSGDTTTFSLTNDAGGRFAINSSTGVITVANSSLLNYESATSHSITIRVVDLAGANSSQALTINLNDVNEFSLSAITDANAATNTVNELAANGSTVGVTASATDQDGSATVTYTLDDSAGGRFAINSSTGVVTKAATLNFESATSHTIVVRATSSDGSSSTTNFTISVTDFNEFSASVPTDTNAGTNEVLENSLAGTLVGLTAFSSDSDGTNNTISYSLFDNAQGRFTIDSTTGVVSLTGNSVNYEQASSHTIIVRATSTDGSFADQSFAINVLNAANEINEITDTNTAPDTMTENAALGSTVITAQTSHPDTLPITYSLTNNAGGLFGIDASTGIITLISALNYETGTSHTITVRADATDGSFAVHNFTITVQDFDEFNVGSISDTNAAANSIAENSANSVTVGLTALASDADGTTNTITYSLDDNAGGRFAINSSTGVVTVANGTLLNFEAATSHVITIRATSADSSSSTANFTINVTDVNEAPTITNAATHTLPSTTEDAPSSGTLASAILSTVSWADVDTAALSGLAITGVTGSGTWRFSTDGVSWTNFGAVTDTNALLITSSTQVRYTPNTQNAETATFTFKAWDRTTGTASVNGTARFANTSSSGGSTAYSSSNATASISVTAVNDAPTVTNAATHALTATNEDTTSSGTLASAILTGVTWADVDTGASNGLAITGTTGSGTWQYSTDGTTWANFGSVSSTNALLITSSTRVRYTPITQNAETATFTFKAWDQTSGTASTNATASYASTASAGGTNAFSTNNATASMSVTAVNDAPTINSGATHNLAPTTEDATSSGTLASAILSGVSWADVDTGALSGLAITATTGSGNWQYSTNGTTWANFGAVSSTNALLITSSTQVRYTPSTQNAETATFSFKAWDQASGTASTNATPSYASTASSGGTTAFSTNNSTASISVTALNDAPTINNGSTYSFTSVNEDTTSAGVLSSTILTNASWVDVDTGAVNGLAITGTTGAGTWQYSTDGNNWSNFGAVSGTNSLLIDSTTQIRYVPNGQNGETATFTYKAWDQTSGVASSNPTPSYASTTTPGGTSAFSINNATGQIVVTSVNDAPTITNSATHTLSSTTEDATSSGTLASAILSGVTWADVDTGALSGLAITGTTGSGTWQYSTNGSTWANFGSVFSTNALLITSTSQVRYIPSTQNAETATFSFKAWDQTSGTASTNATPSYASTASAGGTTAFSTSNATASMSVTAVNDSPTAAGDNAIAVEAGGINNNAGTNPTGNVLTNDTDPDAGDTKTVTGVAAGIVPTASGNVAATVNGTYGSINIAADGTFSYTVDNNNPAVQALRTSANTLLDTFTYTIRDAAGLTSTTQISVTIQGANDTPSDLATTGLTITENAANGTAAGTVTRSDLDAGDGATYSLIDSAGGRFAINSSTGVVTVADGTLIDRETTANHNITVRVTDTAGSFYDEVLTVNVTDADEFDVSLVSDSNPAANGVSENAANGTQTGVTASASDADATNNSITYSLDNSAGGRFAIDSSTGVVTVANGTLLNYEAATSHDIIIRATSADGSSSTQTFTINLTDVDEFDLGPVTDSNAAANSVAENATNGTAVGITAIASDADATTNAITYSLDDSAGGRFAINSSTGAVSVANSSLLNYEAAASHTIVVRAASADGSSSTQSFNINLTDVDEFDVGAIQDLNAAVNNVIENSANGTAVGITAWASDPDATTNAIAYSLDDAAGGRFSINASTGVVTVANGSLLNFEAANSHTITIRATSADGSFSTQSLTINLFNQNEGPTAVNDNPVAVEAGGVSNGAPGTNPTGNVLTNDTDPDGGDTLTVVGVAAGMPASAAGQVGLTIAGQYGSIRVNADGTYLYNLDNSNPAVQALRTTSDTLTDTFTYTMTDLAGIQSTARISILVTGANDDPTAQWSESGLAINSGSSNNQYVQLQDFDDLIGGRSQFTLRVSVSTTQSNFFLLSYATSSQHNEFRIYAYGGTLRLSFKGNDWNTNVSSNLVTDGNRHELAVIRDASLGQLKLFIDGNLVAANSSISPGTNLQSNGVAILAEEQDEVGGDFDSSQFFRGTLWDLSVYDTAWSNSRVANEFGMVSSGASDLTGHWNFNEIVSNQVTDQIANRHGSLHTITGSGWVAGTPAIDRTDWIQSVNEHSANGLTIAILDASDLDSGDTITWSLSNDAGGRFAINASTGEVTIANSSLVDRETAASFQITAIASDTAGGTHARTYTIQLNDVDEFDVSPVVDGNNTPNQVTENSANGSLVGLTAQAFDADATNNSITFSLTDSAGGRFAINSSTGLVTVANGSLLNRESATSHTIIVRAASTDGSISTQSFAINVIDTDEFDVGPISDLNPATNSVNENASVGTAVGITASASDADATNNSIAYTLDNAAGGRFTIDPITGIVTVADSSLLDREAASSHSITIRATSEDGSFTTESYLINLNDIDEFDVTTPADADTGTNQVSEGAANGTTAGITANAGDADATTNTITWTLDDNAGGRFAINSSTGVVTVANGSLLDREVAASHAITIRATSADGSAAVSEFLIQIGNINESPIAVADTVIAIEAGGLNNTTPGLNPVGNVLLNDSDIDSGDTRVVVGVQTGVQSSTTGAVGSAISGLYGSLTLNTDGSYTYTVDNTNPQVEALRNSSAQLVDTFSYTIRDADGLESTTQLAVTVQGANDTPHSMWSETGLTLNSGTSNNQYLQIENLGNLLSSAEFTLRVSLTTTQSSPHILSYATTNHHNDLRISTSSSKLQVLLNGQIWTTSIPRSLLTDGDRHELCLVRTVADGGLKVFIDGVQKDSVTGFKTGVQLGIGGSLVLGQEQDSVGGNFDPNQIFRGTYWDLSVHSTAWSSGRVQLNTGHTFHDLPDLRGHWDFELSGGDTVFDQIGTRHAGLRSIPAGGSWIAGTASQLQADWKPNLIENAANGTLVANLSAAEIDQGGQLTWSLVDDAGGRFAIDANTGRITVADSTGLNFEHLQTHQIIARVTDEGGLSREETYQIHLTDVQESDVSIPIDDNTAPNLVLENSSVGALVGLTAWAIDQDGTTNLVTYSLDDDAGGRFAINSSTGVVTVANGSLLDREAAASHSIVARATSEDGTTATREFTIAVGDVNEFPIGPISDLNTSDNLLLESAPEGTLAGITARASDPDATNNTVRYSLDDSAGGRFVIDENTGVVSVAGDGLFDYESVSSMSIIVRASSTDGSFVTQAFVINLIDVDEFDTGPISDFDTTDNLVYENSEIGTYTGLTAFARDADATNNGITYRLLDDDGGRFRIDSTTGRVFTNALLDFETDGWYRTIQVGAVSEDGSSSTENFLIQIADVYKESFATYAGMDVEFSPTEILTSNRDDNFEITNLTLENAPEFGDLIVVSSTGSRVVSSRDLSSLSISPNERLRFISPATTQGNVTLGYTAMNDAGRERTGTVTILVEAAAPPPPPPPTIQFTNNDSGSTSSSERAPSGDSPSERSVAVERDATASSSSGGEASGSAAGGAVMAVGPISGSGGTAGAAFEFAEDGEASERTADTGAGKSSGDANQQAEKTAGESGLLTSIANLMQNSDADSFASIADSGVVTRIFATNAAIEQKLTNSTQFTEYLSKLETALEQTPIVVGFEMPAYASAGASLFTVGYVAWLIRGGVLLTSFMSSLPSWQSFDPLPILENAGSGDGDSGADGSDSSIAELVDSEQPVPLMSGTAG